MHKQIITENENELITELCKLIENICNESLKERNTFHIGFSGGSMVKFLSVGLPGIKTDFSKWKIFFCDERLVTFDNPDSTFGAYKKELLNKIPLSEDQFVKIKENTTAEDAAEDYVEKLKKAFGCCNVPNFDVLLLGVGPDGHTCSLFPNHPLLKEDVKWVMPITDSPKPPPERITLTFPVINNAKNCLFAMSGDGKAEIVKRILKDKENLPVNLVQPCNGNVYWILDKTAASLLN